MPVNAHGVDIDDLRHELEDIESRSNRGPFFTPQEGRNVIRVLPTWAEGKRFYVKIYGHWINAKKTSYLCLNKMKGEKCYLCEVMEVLRDAGERKKAGQLTPSVRYHMQVIDRKNPEAGVQIFNAGSTIFQSIGLLLDDEDWKDLLDLEKGTDLVLERTGQGLDTDYPSTRPRKNPSPAGIVKGDLLDLESLLTWSSYDEMKAMYDGISGTVASPPAKKEGETKTEGETIDISDKVEVTSEKTQKECYGKYDADAEKCKECSDNFDCEIDTPAEE